jgi:hypothetical protein
MAGHKGGKSTAGKARGVGRVLRGTFSVADWLGAPARPQDVFYLDSLGTLDVGEEGSNLVCGSQIGPVIPNAVGVGAELGGVEADGASDASTDVGVVVLQGGVFDVLQGGILDEKGGQGVSLNFLQQAHGGHKEVEGAGLGAFQAFPGASGTEVLALGSSHHQPLVAAACSSLAQAVGGDVTYIHGQGLHGFGYGSHGQEVRVAGLESPHPVVGDFAGLVGDV